MKESEYISGWVSLHRKLLNKGFAKKPNYLAVWIYLLLKANHSDKEFLFNNETILIRRGQLITSKLGISKYFKISIGTVQNIFKHFISESQIETKISNKFTMVTILNYDSYQNIENKIVNTVKATYKQRESDVKQLNNNNNNNNKINNTGKNLKNFSDSDYSIFLEVQRFLKKGNHKEEARQQFGNEVVQIYNKIFNQNRNEKKHQDYINYLK
ncbi:MAG: hypothetical protein V1779_11575 [bacterium]